MMGVRVPFASFITPELRRQLASGVPVVIECVAEHRGAELAAQLLARTQTMSGDAAATAREAFGRSMLARRLTQLLGSEEEDDAGHALAMIPDLPEECLPELATALGRVGYRERRREALRAFADRGAPAWPALVNALGG